jgi:hypothetical protein
MKWGTFGGFLGVKWDGFYGTFKKETKPICLDREEKKDTKTNYV